MRKMFLLFSHRLTEEQKEQAKEEFDIERFVILPTELQQIWSRIDPDIPTLKEVLQPIADFFQKETEQDDYALIQGDFGAVCIMVGLAKELSVIPVYATTKREAIEYIDADGKVVKKSIFKHRRFREYETKI